MAPALRLALAPLATFGVLSLGLSACAGPLIPSVDPLCGSWQTGEGDLVERWAREGKGLRGEGVEISPGADPRVRETLELEPGRRGHVYVARPDGQATTRFEPIDPGETRLHVDAPATATRWTWANYDHDFPQEIHYVLVDDTLEATIAGWTETGAQVVGWTYTRTETCE